MFSITRYWCSDTMILTFPPRPVVHYFEGCGDVPYPDQIQLTITNTGPSECDCYPLSLLFLNWNPAVGPYGGWVLTDTTCGGAAIQFSLYPVEFGVGGMEWRLDADGGARPGSVFGFVECGHAHLFEGLKFDIPGCGGIVVSASMNWPWAIP